MPKIRVIVNAIRPIRRNALNTTGRVFRTLKIDGQFAVGVQPNKDKIIVLNTHRYSKKRDAENYVRGKFEERATEYRMAA